MTEGVFVAYYRTSPHGSVKRSSLPGAAADSNGIEAQRNAVMRYLNGGSWTLKGEYTEIESGKNSDRPQLERALLRCRQVGGTLIISKIDRLSRDVHFLTGLQKAGVKFLAVDNPNANSLMIHLLIAFAQNEREMISSRTKDALAVVRASGVALGGWKPVRQDGSPRSRPNPTKAIVACQEAADRFARDQAEIAEWRQSGMTLQQIADRLTADGIRTRQGGQWTATAVRNVLKRLPG